jgi:hypothetical protein
VVYDPMRVDLEMFAGVVVDSRFGRMTIPILDEVMRRIRIQF